MSNTSRVSGFVKREEMTERVQDRLRRFYEARKEVLITEFRWSGAREPIKFNPWKITRCRPCEGHYTLAYRAEFPNRNWDSREARAAYGNRLDARTTEDDGYKNASVVLEMTVPLNLEKGLLREVLDCDVIKYADNGGLQSAIMRELIEVSPPAYPDIFDRIDWRVELCFNGDVHAYPTVHAGVDFQPWGDKDTESVRGKVFRRIGLPFDMVHLGNIGDALLPVWPRGMERIQFGSGIETCIGDALHATQPHHHMVDFKKEVLSFRKNLKAIL